MKSGGDLPEKCYRVTHTDTDGTTELLAIILAGTEAAARDLAIDGWGSRGISVVELEREAAAKELQGIGTEPIEEGRFQSVERQLEDIERRLSGCNSAIASLEHRDEARERDAKGMAESIMELRGRVINAEETDGQTVRLLGQVRREVAELENKKATASLYWELSERVKAIEKTVAGNNNRTMASHVEADKRLRKLEAAMAAVVEGMKQPPDGITDRIRTITNEDVERRRGEYIATPKSDWWDAFGIVEGEPVQRAGVAKGLSHRDAMLDAVSRFLDYTEFALVQLTEAEQKRRLDMAGEYDEETGGPLTGFDAQGHG